MCRGVTPVLDICGVRIRVAGLSRAETARLHALYPLWWRNTPAGPVDAEIAFDQERDERARLVDFQQRLDAIVLSRLSGFAVAHAGCVEADGLLLVFAGPSRSGKSTLVTHLVRDGARYYSDEFALIDPVGRLHAYPRPALVRDGVDTHQLDGSVVATLENSLPPPRRPDAILFLEHHADEPAAALSRIDSAGATVGLLRNTPATWAERPGLIRAFAVASASALAYEGVRGEAGVAWEAVRSRIALDHRTR